LVLVVEHHLVATAVEVVLERNTMFLQLLFHQEQLLLLLGLLGLVALGLVQQTIILEQTEAQAQF
jgi:hypothetical protein